MDFFGAGRDVAARMGLQSVLRAIHYPIDQLQFVLSELAVLFSAPIDRIRRALGGNYVYLRRSDLERILYDRAVARGVAIRFGCQATALRDTGNAVAVTFDDGSEDTFQLVFGADGLHSRVRRLVFGEDSRFERFLGGYVAAFHLDHHGFDIGRALKIHEETDRIAMFYPLDATRMAATYAFRHAETRVPADKRLDFVRKRIRRRGLDLPSRCSMLYQEKEPIYFDSLTQIVMPHWYQGRAALLGDACGCLTLLAGKGRIWRWQGPM